MFVRRYGDRVLCYIASSQLGLSIVDVTDTAHPTVVGSLHRPWQGRWQQVEVQGDYAYIVHWADGGDEMTYNGIWIVNVANPASPLYVTMLGGMDLPNSERPSWIRVVGNRGWVADYSRGANEWDLSDPAHPVRIGPNYYQATYNNFSLDVSRGYLYRAEVGALEVYRIVP